jgi:hypothetical protein
MDFNDDTAELMKALEEDFNDTWKDWEDGEEFYAEVLARIFTKNSTNEQRLESFATQLESNTGMPYNLVG